MKMWKLFMFLCLVTQLPNGIAGPLKNKYENYLGLRSVQIFREYLRIDTSCEENIKYAVDFWIREFRDLGIPFSIYKPAGEPILVATLAGANPSLPSIMLNSHMDVVIADASEWKYPPFDAYMDENGDIYGRGAQDTKDVGIQYLQAIRKLKQNNVPLARTLHLTLMPDEETGGKKGMKAFVKTQEFKSLNVGFALDEGLSTQEDFLIGTFVDRRPWQMKFVVHGDGGHGFQLLDNTAMDKTRNLIDAVMSFRDTETQIMKSKNNTDLTGYTSVNINMVHGGEAVNVIPSKVTVTVDMRLAPDANVAQVEELVNSWLLATGNKTDVTYYRKETESGITPVDDSNPYWISLRNTLNEMGIKIKPLVCPATSDSLVLRNLGIPAIGFATKRRTIPRLHAKDEYQNVEIFLKGIDIYTEVIKNLANVSSDYALHRTIVIG